MPPMFLNISTDSKAYVTKLYYKTKLGGKIDPRNKAQVKTAIDVIRRKMVYTNSNWQYLTLGSSRYISIYKCIQKIAEEDLAQNIYDKKEQKTKIIEEINSSRGSATFPRKF